MSRADDFVRKWAPLIGDRSAHLEVFAQRFLGFGGISVPVWALLSGWGISTHSDIVKSIGVILMILDFTIIFAGIVFLHLMFKAMSDFFGIRVSALNSPTFREDSFRKWCECNKIGTSLPGFKPPVEIVDDGPPTPSNEMQTDQGV